MSAKAPSIKSWAWLQNVKSVYINHIYVCIYTHKITHNMYIYIYMTNVDIKTLFLHLYYHQKE